MTFQTLCEIAERELNAGLADATLLERVRAEAGGVEAQARQLYWQRRAKQLQDLVVSEGEASLQSVLAAIEDQERRLRRRKESNRWFWALACIAGMIGAAVFPWFAARALGKPGGAFFIFLVLSLGSLGVAVLGFIASRYHTHTD